MFKFDLTPNEKVLNIYRQSEAVLFKPVVWVMVLIYFPWYFLLKYDLAATFSRLLIFWTSLVFLYALNTYVLWLINVYLITNKRVVLVEYQNLLNKKVSETTNEKILNVGFSVKGFWQVLFKFGSVQIQAVGLAEPLVLKNLAEPSKIKDFLWSVHEQTKI